MEATTAELDARLQRESAKAQLVEIALRSQDPEAILEGLEACGWLYMAQAQEFANAEDARVVMRSGLVDEYMTEQVEWRCPVHGKLDLEQDQIKTSVCDVELCGEQLDRVVKRRAYSATRAEEAARVDPRYQEYCMGVNELQRRTRRWEKLFDVLKLRAQLFIQRENHHDGN